MRRSALVLAALLLSGTPAAASWALRLTGVTADTALDLRTEPDAASASAGTLPADTRDITVVAVADEGVDWVKVEKGAVSGWVDAKFLRYANDLPVRLECKGPDPSWSLSLGFQNALADLPTVGPTHFALEQPSTTSTRRTLWLMTGSPTRFVMIDKRVCSDGRSGTKYPYWMAAAMQGYFVEGCCK
ncbi:MAG TPA: SH3 domain-containing protein [Rhizomicrobium sp.]